MIGFVELFLLIILVKQFSQSVNFFPCYFQNTVKIMLLHIASTVAWFSSILALAPPKTDTYPLFNHQCSVEKVQSYCSKWLYSEEISHSGFYRADFALQNPILVSYLNSK